MKVTIEGNLCLVQREKGDKAFYGEPILANGMPNAWGGGESNLLHHMKLNLNTQGYDFIKKRMHKDGHLVDDLQQYLRARNPKKLKDGEVFCISDGSWATRSSAEDYNTYEEVNFRVTRTDTE